MKIMVRHVLDDGSIVEGWTTPGPVDDWRPHDPNYDAPEKRAEREALKSMKENNPDD